jgi:hypothetical protein
VLQLRAVGALFLSCSDASIVGQWPMLFDSSSLPSDARAVVNLWGELPPADLSTVNALIWGYTQVPLRLYAPSDEQWSVHRDKLQAIEAVSLPCKVIPDDVTLGLIEMCRKRVSSRARIVEIQQSAAISKVVCCTSHPCKADV